MHYALITGPSLEYHALLHTVQADAMELCTQRGRRSIGQDTGTWHINVQQEHQGPTQRSSFQVLEYVLPKFQVVVRPPPYVLANANHLKWKVCARLYSRAMTHIVEHNIENDVENHFSVGTPRLIMRSQRDWSTSSLVYGFLEYSCFILHLHFDYASPSLSPYHFTSPLTTHYSGWPGMTACSLVDDDFGSFARSTVSHRYSYGQPVKGVLHVKVTSLTPKWRRNKTRSLDVHFTSKV
ncbi:hypothetical protein PR048_017953, partial [Dryococelus australis]